MTQAYKKKKAKAFAQSARDMRKTRAGHPILSCGKICYPSLTKARQAVHRTLSTGVAKPLEEYTRAQAFYGLGTLQEYYCSTCEAYHIGNARPLKNTEDAHV